MGAESVVLGRFEVRCSLTPALSPGDSLRRAGLVAVAWLLPQRRIAFPLLGERARVRES